MALIRFESGSGVGSEEWFRNQGDEAAEERKANIKEWQYNAAAYRNRVQSQTPEGIRVNIEFEKTEQKKPQLFYQPPKLVLQPTPRTSAERDGAELKKAVAIFSQVLTRIAGPKGANTAELMEQILFDVLCPSGVGFAKIGYERSVDGTVPLPTGRKIPDPNYIAPRGNVLNINGGGAPLAAPLVDEMKAAPNVIFEKYFADRISPALGLIPNDFRGGDYARDADWLGHDFPITEAEAARRGWNISGTNGAAARDNAGWVEAEDEDRITPRSRKGTRTGQVWCREMYYYASRVDAAVKHPEKLRRIVFANRQVVVHEDCKDQRFDQRGRLSGGLRTNPIKVLALRYVSDLALPPSDCTITRQQSDELAEFRTQQIIHMRRAVPLRWVDVTGIFDPKVKELIMKGKYYDILPTNGPGDRFVGEVARPAYPNENNNTQDYIMNDVNRAWALASPGVPERGGVTATEIASIAQATASRMGKERAKVIGFWLQLVEAFGELAQLYADRNDYIEVAGEDGADAIEVWNREVIKGEFIYDVVPDSSLQPDRASMRDLALNRYNLLANSQVVDQVELARETIEAMDGDPDRLVKPPVAPPPPPEEKPRITLSLSGDDLNPHSPQYPNIVAVLEAQGIKAVPVPPAAPVEGGEEEIPQGPAEVVDRERLRMAEADARDGRRGGFTGTEGAAPL